jgi:hypothetical protein
LLYFYFILRNGFVKILIESEPEFAAKCDFFTTVIFLYRQLHRAANMCIEQLGKWQVIEFLKVHYI